MEQQSLTQNMISLAQNPEHVQAMAAILKRCMKQTPLIGNNEFETIVNAVIIDTNSTIMQNFSNQIEYIKQGGLINEAINKTL